MLSMLCHGVDEPRRASSETDLLVHTRVGLDSSAIWRPLWLRVVPSFSLPPQARPRSAPTPPVAVGADHRDEQVPVRHCGALALQETATRDRRVSVTGPSVEPPGISMWIP